MCIRDRFISESGMIVRTRVEDMRPMGRNTQGVRLVNVKDGDKLVAMEVVSESDRELETRGAAEAAERAGLEGAVGAAIESTEEGGAVAQAPEASEETPSEEGTDESTETGSEGES